MTELLLLIVDDRSFDANYVLYTMADLGFDTEPVHPSEWRLTRGETEIRAVHVDDSEAALAAVVEHRPENILMDVFLDGSPVDGFGLTKQILALDGDPPTVVIMTTDTRPESVKATQECGAQAHLEKLTDDPFKDVIDAYLQVIIGNNFCPPEWVGTRFVWIHDSWLE